MKKILAKLEVILKVDLRYILKNGLWLTLDDVISVVVSTILTIIFANTVSKEVYGSYRYILSVFGILTIATLPNMNIALASSVARGEEGIIHQALRTRIRWGLLGAVASLAFGGYQLFLGRTELGIAFFVTAIFLPVMDSLNLYDGFLRGKKLFNLQSQYSIAARLISTGALIFTLFYTKNLIAILFAFFLPYVLTRLFFYQRTLKKNPSVPSNGSSETITYGKHLSLLQLLGVLVNYLDNLLIFHYLGAAPLAIYSIAMAPIKKIQQAFSVLPDLALPKFSARTIAETKQKLPAQIIRGLIAVGVVIIAYVLLAPVLFDLFFSKYRDALPYTRLLTLAWVGLPFSLIYTLFQAHAKKKEIYLYNLILRLGQLILIIWLVASYGIYGAVLARILLQAISIPLFFYLFKKIKDTKKT